MVWPVVIFVLFLVFVCGSLGFAIRAERRRRQRREEAMRAPQVAAAGEAAAPATASKPQREAVWPWYLLAAWIVFALFQGRNQFLQDFGADWRLIPPSIAELDGRVEQFANIAGLRENLSEEPLAGKVIVIDKTKLTLHPLTRDLPKDRVASGPDEVGIVVWVEATRTRAFDLTLATVRQATPLGQPSQPQPTAEPKVTIPAYRAKWSIKVIDLATKEVRYKGTFAGAEPPGTSVTIKRPYGAGGQSAVYDADKRVRGAEILFGESGGVELVTGKRAVGIVGAVPWDEPLAWLKQALGIDPR